MFIIVCIKDHIALVILLKYRFRVLQTKQDGEFGDLQMQLKLKSFETERSGIVHEETSKALTSAHMLSEKLQKKLDVYIYLYICIHVVYIYYRPVTCELLLKANLISV